MLEWALGVLIGVSLTVGLYRASQRPSSVMDRIMYGKKTQKPIVIDPAEDKPDMADMLGAKYEEVEEL